MAPPNYWQTSGLAGPTRYDRNGLPESYNYYGHHIYQLGDSWNPGTSILEQPFDFTPGTSPVGEPETSSSFDWNNVAGGLSIGLAIGNALGGIFSSFSSASTSKYVAEKQAQISEDNRQRAQMSAESAYRQGEAQVAQATYQAGQVKAKQRTAMAANGVITTSGSAAEVMTSTDIMKEVDKANAQLSAISSAWGYKQQAAQQQANANTYRTMGSYASSSSWALGTTSLLEGGLTAAERWYKYFR